MFCIYFAISHNTLQFYIFFCWQLQFNILELLIITLYVFYHNPQYSILLYILLLANTT